MVCFHIQAIGLFLFPKHAGQKTTRTAYLQGTKAKNTFYAYFFLKMLELP